MHTRLTTGSHSGVYTATNSAGQVVWVGKIAHPEGETPDELGVRWDAFAGLMFAYGVEPVRDDPDYSTLVDGEVTDTYRLQEIEPEGDA